jgi:hypothetical protein
MVEEHVLHDSGMSLKSFDIIVSFSAKQYRLSNFFHCYHESKLL